MSSAIFPINKNKKAILFGLVAAFGFSIQDTAVKALTSNASIWQLMFIRSLIVVSALGLWVLSVGTIKKNKTKDFNLANHSRDIYVVGLYVFLCATAICGVK